MSTSEFPTNASRAFPTNTTMLPPFPMFPSLDGVPFAVSPEVYMQIAYYGNTILSPFLCLFGLCGNSLGLYIMYNDKKRKDLSIYSYMMALMVFDNIFLVIGVVLSGTSIIEFYDRYLANSIFTHFSFAGGYFDFLMFHATSVLLIVMSVERLQALVSPFTFKQSWLSMYPNRIIFGIAISFGLMLLPYPFCFEVIELPDFIDPSETIYLLATKPEFEEFYKQYGFIEGIISLIYPIVLFGLNLAIPIAFRRFKQRRKQTLKSAAKDNQQLKVTVTVVCVTVLYILLSIPKIFIQVLVFYDDRYNFTGVYGLTFFLFTALGDVFGRINAANDFVIYVLLSERYRRLIRIAFCRRCISEQDASEWSEFQNVSGVRNSAASRKTQDISNVSNYIQNEDE